MRKEDNGNLPFQHCAILYNIFKRKCKKRDTQRNKNKASNLQEDNSVTDRKEHRNKLCEKKLIQPISSISSNQTYLKFTLH